jgi:hypothetical protein
MPFPISEDIRETVRHHFRKKQLVWEEAYFVNVLQTSADKFDVYWSVIALRDCGTQACLQALQDKFTFPMQDVKCGAILTIAHIAGAEATPVFVDALVGTSFRDKGYPMWAIQDVGDERAVEPVLGYFKKNQAKLKSGKLTNNTLVDGLDYLAKYRATNAAVAGFFDEVTGFWSNLPQPERSEISKRVPFFAAHAAGATKPA